MPVYQKKKLSEGTIIIQAGLALLKLIGQSNANRKVDK